MRLLHLLTPKPSVAFTAEGDKMLACASVRGCSLSDGYCFRAKR